jgi:hypothetical protein
LADRVDYYFRQRVTEAELDLGFELLERADRNLVSDLGVRGIIGGAVPAPREPVADLTIDLTAPARAYDRLGQRVFFGTGQRVDCSTDHAGLPTEVPGAGEERWLGVFIRFERLLSDPRTDGNSREVFFRRDESFAVYVRQGPAAPSGAAPRVALEPDALLVCDVRRRNGQTQIVATDIDVSRREAFVFATGDAVGILTGAWSTLAPAANTAQASLDAVDAALTAHFTGAGRRHRASQIDLPARGFISATNVEGAIHELVDDLGSVADGFPGAARVGADAVPGAPLALGPSTVDAQLSQIAGAHNAHAGAASGAHHASAISATPHSYIAATNVQGQLQEFASDLALAASGAAGASRIGAAGVVASPRALPAGTVEAQLVALLAGVNNVERHVVDQEWTYTAPRRRTVLLMPDAGADATRSTTTLPGWVRTQVSFAGGVYFPLQARTADASWIWQLRLPAGSVLRGLRALVRPGIARSTATSRMGLRFWSAELRFATGGGPLAGRSSSVARDNGATVVQVLDVGALAEPIENATRVYYAQVDAGTPMGSDLLYGLEVSFDQNGVREH